jgi:glutamyl-tRNA synthetase
MTVVTRFAPSPTGMLHIGGARTALFNWLFSRHHGGQFLLRVEDTDRERSTDDAVEAIFEGLRWLGLDWDQDPVFQSRNQARHQDVAAQLLAEGKAYHCYASPEELSEMREAAIAAGNPMLHDGRWRDRDPSKAPDGVKPVIRFRAPDQGETVIDDQVQGNVTFDASQLDDMILVRSNGTPTYMLAVVVDDHDMKITHVIRGVDHLTNAARQAQLFMALGWDVPVFAHIPLIHGPDGAKLSKRHGALAAQAYRDQGFLPEAMRNYLARLGWAHGDDEIFATDQMIEWFGLDAVGKSPARFDMDKLRSLNGTYIQQATDARLIALILPALGGDSEISAAKLARVTALMPELKKRAKDTPELTEKAKFLVMDRPIEMVPKAAKLLKEDAPALLGKILNQLKTLENWSSETLENCVKEFAETENLKLRSIAQPLRAALTGSNASPGIFDVLAVLGREESLGRIEDAAAKA